MKKRRALKGGLFRRRRRKKRSLLGLEQKKGGKTYFSRRKGRRHPVDLLSLVILEGSSHNTTGRGRGVLEKGKEKKRKETGRGGKVKKRPPPHTKIDKVTSHRGNEVANLGKRPCDNSLKGGSPRGGADSGPQKKGVESQAKASL